MGDSTPLTLCPPSSPPGPPCLHSAPLTLCPPSHLQGPHACTLLPGDCLLTEGLKGSLIVADLQEEMVGGEMKGWGGGRVRDWKLVL